MRRWNRQVVIALALLLGVSGAAHAELQQSNSYSINESELGAANGDFSSGSAHFSNVPGTDDSGSTLGDNFVGNSGSASYQTNAGLDTTAQPGLTLVVNQSSMDLGILSTILASSATASFTVTDYTSYGYVVQVFGTPPTYNGHQLTPMGNNASPASPGTAEQFGMNLRANTSPNSVGQDENEVPDNQTFDNSSFSHGQAGNYAQAGTTYGTNMTYSVPNKYTYNSGDIIASSAKTSGPTLFTMSFMANIKNTTPGGRYTGSLTFVATGTF